MTRLTVFHSQRDCTVKDQQLAIARLLESYGDGNSYLMDLDIGKSKGGIQQVYFTHTTYHQKS